METNNIDNPPAFARPDWNPGYRDQAQKGMSLRDYFAAKAMQAIIISEGVYKNNGPGSTTTGVVPSEAAIAAYQFADAILKARQTTNKE